ncbi:MAG TPA: hypothetical protein VK425_09790 [Acidimicrobiales bacterium]|nr:hypothetical protein [Acidimicrobiales bacterium]
MKQQRIAIVAGATLVVVLALWYVLMWRPETSHLKTARAAEATAAAQLASDQSQLVQLRVEAPKVAKEEAVLLSLVKAVPDGPSLDEVFHTLNSAAGESGVALTSVGSPEPTGWGEAAPSSAPASTGPSSVSLSLGVSGTISHVLQFIRALDSQPRLYVVQSFSLTTPSPPSGMVSTSITVQTFFQSASSNNPVFPGAPVGLSSTAG